MQFQARARQGRAVLSPQPLGPGEGLYLLLVADVPRGGSPGDGGDGVPRRLAGQSDLILQLHGCLVLHVGDFGFGWGGEEKSTFTQLGLRVKPVCHQQCLGRTGTIYCQLGKEQRDFYEGTSLQKDLKNLLCPLSQLRLLREEPVESVQMLTLGITSSLFHLLAPNQPFAKQLAQQGESHIPEHFQIPGRQESPWFTPTSLRSPPQWWGGAHIPIQAAVSPTQVLKPF